MDRNDIVRKIQTGEKRYDQGGDGKNKYLVKGYFCKKILF